MAALSQTELISQPFWLNRPGQIPRKTIVSISIPDTIPIIHSLRYIQLGAPAIHRTQMYRETDIPHPHPSHLTHSSPRQADSAVLGL